MMKKTFLTVFALIVTVTVFSSEYIRLSFDNFNKFASSVKTVDIAGSKKGVYYDIIAGKQDLDILKQKNIKYTILHIDVDKGEYKTLSQYYEKMDSLSLAYPSICDLDTLGFTYEGRPIVIMKINGNNPSYYNGGKSFLLIANHHAREWQTIPLAMFFAESLLSSYGNVEGVTKAIDSSFIVIVPTINPDGYYYSHDIGSDTYWRKNRTFRDGNYGVDLNRNYKGGCNKIPDSEWGFPSGISHNPSDETSYCGPYGSSETEVRIIESLVKDFNFDISISLHSFGEDILYSWGSIFNETPDDSLIKRVVYKIASHTRKQDGVSYYDTCRSAGLYPTTGDSDDWIYGYTKFVKGKTTIPFTFEVDVTFQPSSSTLDSLYRRVFPGILEALYLVDSVNGKTNETVLKPDVFYNGFDSLYWTALNKELTDYYELIHYTGMNAICDSQNDTTNYEVLGVNLSTVNPYSGMFSYNPINQNTSSQILQFKKRINPSITDSLVFFVKYDLELNYDKTFIEKSKNGYEFSVLDSINGIFTGSDNSWHRVSLSLSALEGEEYYIRFRSIFDESTLLGGVFLDNISPLIAFETESIFEDHVTDTFIDMSFDGSSVDEYMTVTAVDSSMGAAQVSDRVSVQFLSLPELDSIFINSIKVLYDIKSRELILSTLSSDKKDLILRIFRSDGALAMNKNLSLKTRVSVDLNSLKSGKYFIEVSGEKINRTGILILK